MTQKMTGRQWLALAGIAVAAFVFNSSEFMPVGLLTDIGNTFGTSEATTGMLVSVYAWAVMLLSVPLTIIVKIALEQTAGGQSIAVLLSDLNKE